ncbi:MAG TPA: hypothetical protein VL172_11815 [Kofleriaceae bacterium]|nr:hypothetical protein [Kofleriaceae bacterium]
MLRSLLVAALLLAPGCGKNKAPAGEPIDMGDPSCTDAASCVTECEHGLVASCALASTIYTLGYKVTADPDLGGRYRVRYQQLRERGCKQEHRPLCDDSAPNGQAPDWPAIRDQCQKGDLNSCLMCKAGHHGDDCGNVPP